MFLGQSALPEHRKLVDHAMHFLAQDTSELEATSAANLQEVWSLLDGLLACAS